MELRTIQTFLHVAELRLWQGRKVYRLTVGFFLPLTNEDETCRFCQGLHLRGRWHFAKRND